MKITEKMYLLAKEIVKEYEKENLNLIPKLPKKEVSVVSINEIEVIDPKLVKPKSKNVQSKEYSQEVHNCYLDCLYYFDTDLMPSAREADNWLDTIDKLNRIDGLAFDDIVLLVKTVRNDDFWSKNFLSLVKLRRKNKEGVVYWKVFKEKFKNNNQSAKPIMLADKMRKDYGIK